VRISGISKVELSLEELELVLQTLVYDGRLEEVTSFIFLGTYEEHFWDYFEEYSWDYFQECIEKYFKLEEYSWERSSEHKVELWDRGQKLN
jgi:hypothetical protein